MLTRREQNFVMHGMLAHLELTKMGHSIVYDEKEKLRIESIREKLEKTRDPKLTKDEYSFLCFVLAENRDFLAEGIGTPYLDPKSDRAITTNALTKLSHATI